MINVKGIHHSLAAIAAVAPALFRDNDSSLAQTRCLSTLHVQGVMAGSSSVLSVVAFLCKGLADIVLVARCRCALHSWTSHCIYLVLSR